jgi:hypothetical protein
MLGYSSLAIYYKTVFALAQHHKYSISDIEGLIPFERDLYVDMLIDFLEKQKENR